MENSDIGWNDIIGTSGPKKKDTIDSVIDAFSSILSTTSSDAILGTGWQMSDKKNVGYKTKDSEVASKAGWGETFSATSNQDERESSWSSWGNGNGSSSWENNNNSNGWGNDNSGWGNDDNQNYPTNNINSAYTDDRSSYQDINKVTNTGTNSYIDNASEINQVNDLDMYTNNINNFSKTQLEYDNHGWSQQQQQQQQQQQSYYEHQESPSSSESDASTDQNSEAVNTDEKIMAWHSLVSPDFKERDDGVGGGQLHRRGRNYNPVDEATVLAIQQKGGGYRKGGRRGSEKSMLKKPTIKLPPKPVPALTTKQINNSYVKSATAPKASVPAKAVTTVKAAAAKTTTKRVVIQDQKQNTQPTPPNRTQQQIQPALKKSSPPPSQSSQRQPSRDARDALQPSQDSSRSQQLQQSQQPQQLQQLQQPQRSEQPQQSQKQHSWTGPQLVNEPFWETTPSPLPSPPPIQHPSPKKYANEVISNQSQHIRHQSPARSPRPAKPVQDYSLPYIPPEFDSTPYRKQPSPSPVRDKPHRYNGPVTNDWEDGNYEQNNNVEVQRNEYYESDVERRENKFGHILEHKEPEKEQVLRVNRYDRGQLLLTINVELSEGKTQAIEVHVNDDPMDLAKDFCELWKVTNPVVLPALECLIKEEKEKRLAIN